MNSSVECMGYFLGLAPCPPPFFYNKFEKFALGINLNREEVCKIANRCMSKYPTENSSQTAERICSPPTEPLTSTVQSTSASMVQTTTSEKLNVTYHDTRTEPSSVSTPSMSSTTPTIIETAGCNTTCITIILILVVIVVFVFIIMFILWYRKQGVLHLYQIRWCCKNRRGDQQCFENENYIGCEVNYVNMSDDIKIFPEGESFEEKDKHNKHDRRTGSMVMRLSDILQHNVQSNVTTTGIQTHGYENRNRNNSSIECDTSEESSIEEVIINANSRESETGSMITHVSSTLILDSVEPNDTIINLQTETSIKVKENMNTEATKPSSVQSDNSNVVDKKDEGLDLKGKIDGDGEKGNDKKEADMEHGPSIDIHKNKKHPTDTQQHKSEVAEEQRKKTADDDDMNMGPGEENKKILEEDESILKSSATETVKDVISQENVEANGGGEKVGMIGEIESTEQEVQYSVTSMQ